MARIIRYLGQRMPLACFRNSACFTIGKREADTFHHEKCGRGGGARKILGYRVWQILLLSRARTFVRYAKLCCRLQNKSCFLQQPRSGVRLLYIITQTFSLRLSFPLRFQWEISQTWRVGERGKWTGCM